MARSDSNDVSRAGQKLAAALDAFGIDPAGRVCADLGSNVGGFVECLLRRGAAKVYAVERGYGVLDYRLRQDPRVIVRERTDALRVTLPEPVQLVTIDAGWTRQEHILPAAMRVLDEGGDIISLIKPHYESPADVRRGVLPLERIPAVLDTVRLTATTLGLTVQNEIQSPVPGQSGNIEFLCHLRRTTSQS